MTGSKSFRPITSIDPPERGAYEALGMSRIRCKLPLSTFIFFCNRGFARRLQAAGGDATQWGALDPGMKCVCVGEALDSACAVSVGTMQRLLANAQVMSCGNAGRGGGSAAGMATSGEFAFAAALEVAGYDPVVSRHVSVRLSSLDFAAVDMAEFVGRWSAGYEPSDMIDHHPHNGRSTPQGLLS